MARSIWILCPAVLVIGGSCAEEVQPPCFVELPAFGPQGEPLTSKIAAVYPPPEQGDSSIDLLTIPQRQYRMMADGNRLDFPKEFVGRTIMVTFESERHRTLRRRVVLTACHQRTSIVFGESDSAVDVASSTVSGRISGCEIAGDWWVRAMPMFGGQDSPTSYEGYVAGDGLFHIDASFAGHRHILIIGRGKDPVRAIPVNVVVGG